MVDGSGDQSVRGGAALDRGRFSECRSGTDRGYGGMVFTNSRHNRIENNYSRRFEDEGPSRATRARRGNT